MRWHKAKELILEIIKCKEGVSVIKSELGICTTPNRLVKHTDIDELGDD